MRVVTQETIINLLVILLVLVALVLMFNTGTTTHPDTDKGCQHLYRHSEHRWVYCDIFKGCIREDLKSRFCIELDEHGCYENKYTWCPYDNNKIHKRGCVLKEDFSKFCKRPTFLDILSDAVETIRAGKAMTETFDEATERNAFMNATKPYRDSEEFVFDGNSQGPRNQSSISVPPFEGEVNPFSSTRAASASVPSALSNPITSILSNNVVKSLLSSLGSKRTT